MTTRGAARLMMAVGVVFFSTAAMQAIPAQAASTSPSSTIRSYFQALESGTPRSTPKAVTLSAPGSPAGKLALHDVAFAQIAALSQRQLSPVQVHVVNRAVFVCAHGTKLGPSCNKFTDVQTDSRGRVVTFSTATGPLADRIHLGNGQSAPIVGPQGTLAIAKVYSAYEDSGGDLDVVAQVRPPTAPVTGGTLVVNFHAATYVRPDGTTVAPVLNYATKKEQRGALRVGWSFPNSSFGGHVVLTTFGRPPTPALAGTAQLPIN